MTDLEKYKSACERFRFLVHLWLDEDCGCTCSQCEEYLEEAEKLLEPTCPPAPPQQ